MCHFRTLPVMLFYLGQHNSNLMLLFPLNTNPLSYMEPSRYNIFRHVIKTCPYLWCTNNESQTVGSCICVIIELFVTHPAISVPLHLRHAAPVRLMTPALLWPAIWSLPHCLSLSHFLPFLSSIAHHCVSSLHPYDGWMKLAVCCWASRVEPDPGES